MTREVVKLAIKDLKKIINDIESKSIIIEEENIKLEKEIHSFLSSLSAYKVRNIKRGNDLLSGFQRAFNLVKHNKKIITIKQITKGGLTFPATFPLEIFSNRVFWIDASNLTPDPGFESQHYNYIQNLSNKRMIETLNKLEKII